MTAYEPCIKHKQCHQHINVTLSINISYRHSQTAKIGCAQHNNSNSVLSGIKPSILLHYINIGNTVKQITLY